MLDGNSFYYASCNCYHLSRSVTSECCLSSVMTIVVMNYIISAFCYSPTQISYILHLTSVRHSNCICNTCNIVTRNWPINMISVNWGREITENIWNLWIRFKPLVNQIYRVLVVCGMIGMSPPALT